MLSALGVNLVLKDKKMLINQRKPFDAIGEMKEKIEILLDVYEPDDLLDNTSYSDTSSPVISNLLADIDTVRIFWKTTQEHFYVPSCV